MKQTSSWVSAFSYSPQFCSNEEQPGQLLETAAHTIKNAIQKDFTFWDRRLAEFMSFPILHNFVAMKDSQDSFYKQLRHAVKNKIYKNILHFETDG